MADVTLERGGTQGRYLFDWFQDLAINSSGFGLTDANYRRNFDIVQQDRDGTTLRRWALSRTWPVRFAASDWDNEALTTTCHPCPKRLLIFAVSDTNGNKPGTELAICSRNG